MKDKEKFLEVFENNTANISAACAAAGIARSTFYLWMKEDPDFKDQAEAIQESMIDLAESKLLENIKSNKETSIIFYLKTKGKSRGYVEKQIIEQDGFPNKIEIEIIDENKG